MLDFRVPAEHPGSLLQATPDFLRLKIPSLWKNLYFGPDIVWSQIQDRLIRDSRIKKSIPYFVVPAAERTRLCREMVECVSRYDSYVFNQSSPTSYSSLPQQSRERKGIVLPLKFTHAQPILDGDHRQRYPRCTPDRPYAFSRIICSRSLETEGFRAISTCRDAR